MPEKKKPSANEANIMRYVGMHDEWEAVGITDVFAVRKLASDGLLVIVRDEADENGIGRVTVRRAD